MKPAHVTLRHAGDIVAAGIGTRYTAAVLRIDRGGRAVCERAYGTLDAQPDAHAARAATRFDVASLTKVFVTVSALECVARGELTLDEPVARLLPAWSRDEHATITLRMLLAHTAGMQSGADYRTLLGKNVVQYVLSRPLVAPPGTRVVYSDLGYIALGALLETLRARSLAAVVTQTARALGCDATAFAPERAEHAAIPATEADEWRGRVRGRVHDEKAHLMGGVAGHAGLFATAHDVARMAEAFLAHACGRANPTLPATLARAAIAEHGPDAVLRRGLGWALKTSDKNSCGSAMHPASFGHTGFTGTSVWADPTRDLSVVLLTNAVYYGRRDVRDVRAAVCDAAVAEYA